jgi:site-specific DNA recombinase
LGLRNRANAKLTRTTLADLLRNPFYIGLIRISRTQETFRGIHQPLVSKSLFDRVQQVLTGKSHTRAHLHNFLFRRLLKCKGCGYTLTGERQKGHVYYRCQTKNCATTGIREEAVEKEVLDQLSRLQFTDQEKTYFQEKIQNLQEDWGNERRELTKTVSLRLNQIEDHLNRLTDAYIDGVIEKEIFERRKTALLMEQRELEEKLIQLKEENQSIPHRLAEFLELAGSAYLQYKFGLLEEKRDLLKIITSNRLVEGKRVDITFSFPFSEVANRSKNSNGGPMRMIPRTSDLLLSKLIPYFLENPALKPETSSILPKL